ncbi:MAG TPA: hypothetical protein VMJ10_13955 [Kofleriaceae bacterium]|nr:hypothetical protein [Kofleriaceae bacterium]
MQRILARTLLVALSAVGCSSGSDDSQQIPTNSLFPQGNNDECSTQEAKLNIAVDEAKATAPLQLRIESCRLDADACMDLCTYELDNLPSVLAIFGATAEPVDFGGDLPTTEGGGTLEPPIDNAGITPSDCKVTFDGGTANASIGYQAFSSDGGCAEPGTNGGSGAISSPPTTGGGP